MGLRRNAPVFVIGSPRSGTTLFYHMLLSSGDFAIYLSEAHVFNMIAPRFGLSGRRGRKRFLDLWLRSEYFGRSGLGREEIRALVMDECRSGADFLRVLMETIAERQGMPRWTECTPDNVLAISEIKREIPDALFVHMIRDGRDVALSLELQGWVKPFPWDKTCSTLVAGFYWEWLVREGRSQGARFPADYMEVSYEELIANPQGTLDTVASFIEHELDYEKIRRVGIGSVSDPNTSFRAEASRDGFNPVGRWRKGYSSESLALFEGLIGPTLVELGYPLSAPADGCAVSFAWKARRRLYCNVFAIKHFLKTRTLLGRHFTNIELLRNFHAFDNRTA